MIRLFHRRPSAPTPPETYAQVEDLGERYRRLEIPLFLGDRFTFEIYADLSMAAREILDEVAQAHQEKRRERLRETYARLGVRAASLLTFAQFLDLDPYARDLLVRAALRRLRDWHDNPRVLFGHVVLLC